MAQVSFRIDDKIKKDAEQVCDDIGISMKDQYFDREY